MSEQFEILSKSSIGSQGENTALSYYQEHGWDLVTKNFQYYQKGRSGRRAEIDLILKKDNILLIVEVKVRQTKKFGTAIDSINAAKLTNIKSGLAYFLVKHQLFKHFFIKVEIFCLDFGKVSIFPVHSL